MGYARILKDNNGKLSGYRECDGEVAFMPEQQSYENIFRRVKIDLATMEVLNHDFIKDKERVYRRGVLLRGITPKDFHVFNPAYIGNHQIIYTPYGDAKIAHPETCHAVRLKTCKKPAAFTILTDGYTKDDERVYFCQVTVKRAIPQSFAVLSDGYACDEKHIFWRDQLLKAKVQNFMLLSDGYACDDKHIFWGNRLVDADFDSFRVMEDGNAEDNYHYFFHGTMIKKKVQR